MNKNIIFSFIFIALAIAVVGTYFWSNYAVKPISLESEDIVFSSLINGCAESIEQRETLTKGNEIEQEPKIEINKNSVIYSRAINHICCRKVEVEKEVRGSVLNIYEVWGGDTCKCMCFTEIGARFDNVPLGIYSVNVYEKGKIPSQTEESIELKLIISQNISI